ncbi:MAG TPA: hypothetical protein VGM80_01525 [Gaiellaceae bacterium]
MAAHPHPLVHVRPSRVHLWRLPVAITAAALVAGADLTWKAAVLTTHHGAYAMDQPTSIIRPAGAIAVGLLALVGVLMLPPLCVPGALLVVGGAVSNIASLALWHAVPNPLGVHVAGGILHFCLADVCVWTGGLLFLLPFLWTVWRMPAERFA